LFFENYEELLSKFQEDTVTIDHAASLHWLKGRPDRDAICEELDEFLKGELMTKSVSDVNVHLKLESLLKEVDSVIDRFPDQKVRVIAWQRKAVACLFSPIFKILKQRLKQLLKSTVVYTDGMTPDAIATIVSQCGEVHHIYENDLSKQDRQTDEHLINFEMLVYSKLGMDADVLEIWRTVHGKWRWKSVSCKGWLEFMRTTGQASTALGNCLINLLIHWRIAAALKDSLNLMLVLGDDMITLYSGDLNMRFWRGWVAENYNMTCTDHIDEDIGVFCSYLISIDPETQLCHFGPNFRRLRRRYEVPNGVSEMSEEVIASRALSYLFMMGANTITNRAVKTIGYDLNLPRWHDWHRSVNATALYEDCNIQEVENDIACLIKMILKPEIVEFQLLSLRNRGF
jgi:hypothetical protein